MATDHAAGQTVEFNTHGSGAQIGCGPGDGGARNVWTSKDPLVADLANKIEDEATRPSRVQAGAQLRLQHGHPAGARHPASTQTIT
jgi:hypothetical protein